MRTRTLGLMALAATIGLGATACAEDTTSIETETALLSVAPEGGSTGVDSSEPIEVAFDHGMHDHVVDYMAVHEGDVTGPEVAGAWMMEQEGTLLHFTPEAPLKEGTQYTIHLGGGMEDVEGHRVDLETHGMGMGGMWATDSMMTGGMMGGQHSHMSDGWQHPDNGSYGMVFSFTTAGTAPSALVAVDPEGGAMAVDPTEPVTVTFNHAIDSMMVDYAALHEGDIDGPEVAGIWSLSEDATQLVFTPDEALEPATDYTIHIGGNMMDEDGNHMDLETRGTQMGGDWAMGSMMGGGMMGGDHPHMDEGWQHPDNGSYGMIFTFTTAA
ncbi:MAG: Ig-like domain-containing protein [Longimicrobiales bacterium]